MIQLFQTVVEWLTETVGAMGYTGIVALMCLESSFFPFPSEVVMLPAGYLVWKGEMSFVAAVAAGVAGSVLGALFNYWFALRFGRPFLIRYGKYFFVSRKSIEKAEEFFAKYGHVSTLIGRMLPVIRQYISLPAGVARMKKSVFIIYTAAGAAIWLTLLTAVGYVGGEHIELVERYLPVLTALCVAIALLAAAAYYFFMIRPRRAGEARGAGGRLPPPTGISSS
ncbi:MAG: DedA family protein [Synergistaceae bacterium]|jgi:membrane protein DedA with SNARE-associated domain|nr:DedA family protein [Synergistaceae bacterium]